MSLAAVAAIVIAGLAANDPVPGVYVQTNFAQGDVAGSSAERPIVVLANKLAVGTAVNDTTIYGPDTLVQLQTEADMIALAGAGSEAHRMYRRIVKINNSTAVYWVFVSENGSAVQATGTITIATTSTGSGSQRTWIGDEFIETGFIAGSTPTVIAGDIVTNINSRAYLGVTAANVAGVITLTARQKGPRGNDIRFQTWITPGVGTTTTATSDAGLSGGTTADSPTTALQTILPRGFYYIVSADGTSTWLSAVSTQVGLQADPLIGIRQRFVAASVDTLANSITIATGLNSARGGLVWQEKSQWTPAELAANQAAIFGREEIAPNPETNFCGYGNDEESSPYWLVPKSRVDAAVPTRPSIKSALNNGLMPIGVNTNGSTYLVAAITTRSLSGSTADYRTRPWHKVTVIDFYAADWQAKMILQNARCRFVDDPKKGEPYPTYKKARWPAIIKMQTDALTDDYARNLLVQNADEIKAKTKVQREANPTTRCTARIPIQVIDNLEQIAGSIDQVA